jgi:hypothetical protein
MAFTEEFFCDVCDSPKNEGSEDWWLAWTETFSPLPGQPEQTVIKITPWHSFLAHSADVRHLCGARCAHTLMDRWMLSGN